MKKTKDKPFSRLGAAAKRVAIAKDVIKQIKTNKINIDTGIWARIEVEHPDCNDDYDSMDLGKNALLHGLPPVQPKISCTCCAVGAAFLSSIRLFNVATVQVGDAEQDEAFEQLENYFSRDQLDLIEEAFEKGGGACHTDSDKAVEFGHNYSDDEKRALAIFQNIVKNKGTFKP